MNEFGGCVNGNYFIRGNNIHFVCSDSSVPEYVMEYSIDDEERLHLDSLFVGEVCERLIN
jgi:hypothetical protein